LLGSKVGCGDADAARRFVTLLAQYRQLGFDFVQPGAKMASTCSPAVVSATLRVVRVTSRMPMLSSSARMV
jgi:hypothetical protein